MSEETNNNVQPEVQTQEPEQPPVKEKKTFGKKLDNYFGISKAGSSIGTEIVAGIVTFLAMAYILVVNPNAILSSNAAATEWSSVFLATAFGAVIGTVLMAFVAKMPLAQASGMGLNYTVAIPWARFWAARSDLRFLTATLCCLSSSAVFCSCFCPLSR